MNPQVNFTTNMASILGVLSSQRLTGAVAPNWAKPILEAIQVQAKLVAEQIKLPPTVTVNVDYIPRSACQTDMGVIAITVRAGPLLAATLTGFTEDYISPGPERKHDGEIEYTVFPLASRTFTDMAKVALSTWLSQKYFTSEDHSSGQAKVMVMSHQIIYNDVLSTKSADEIAQLILTVFSASMLMRATSMNKDFSPPIELLEQAGGTWVPELTVGHNDCALHGSFIAADGVLTIYYSIKQGNRDIKTPIGKIYIKGEAKYMPNYNGTGHDTGRTWQPVLAITGVECMINQSPGYICFLLSFLNQICVRDIWQTLFVYNVKPELRMLREPGGYLVEAPLTAPEIAAANADQGNFLRNEPIQINSPSEYQTWWTHVMRQTFHRNPVVAICANRASGDTHWSRSIVHEDGKVAMFAVAEVFHNNIATLLGTTNQSTRDMVAMLTQRYPVMSSRGPVHGIMTGMSVSPSGDHVSTMRLLSYHTHASLMAHADPKSVRTFGWVSSDPRMAVSLDKRISMASAVLPDWTINIHDYAEVIPLNTNWLNMLAQCTGLTTAPIGVVVGADNWQNANDNYRNLMANGLGYEEAPQFVNTARMGGSTRVGTNPYGQW